MGLLKRNVFWQNQHHKTSGRGEKSKNRISPGFLKEPLFTLKHSVLKINQFSSHLAIVTGFLVTYKTSWF